MSARHKRKLSYGMTLIEILIVIGVIGILGVATAYTVSKQLSKAKDVKMKNDFFQIRNALFSYYEEIGCFPNSIPSCGSSFEANGSVYMAKIPCASDNTNYVYESDGNTCSAWFRLVGVLQNTNDKDIDLVGCRSGCGSTCMYNYALSSTNVQVGSCTGITPTPTTLPGTPTPTLAPTSTPPPGSTPTPTGPMFACAPPTPGRCIEYADPGASGCPTVYYNDPTCENECNRPQNQCRDERGKKN